MRKYQSPSCDDILVMRVPFLISQFLQMDTILQPLPQIRPSGFGALKIQDTLSTARNIRFSRCSPSTQAPTASGSLGTKKRDFTPPPPAATISSASTSI